MFTCMQLHKALHGQPTPGECDSRRSSSAKSRCSWQKSLNELFNWPGEVTTCLILLIPNDSGLLAVCASTSICTWNCPLAWAEMRDWQNQAAVAAWLTQRKHRGAVVRRGCCHAWSCTCLFAHQKSLGWSWCSLPCKHELRVAWISSESLPSYAACVTLFTTLSPAFAGRHCFLPQHRDIHRVQWK